MHSSLCTRGVRSFVDDFACLFFRADQPAASEFFLGSLNICALRFGPRDTEQKNEISDSRRVFAAAGFLFEFMLANV